MPTQTTQVWRFGLFEIDAEREELRRSGLPIKLREQSFRVLALLVEHAGELVTRDDLCKALWPADTYVDFDHCLNVAVMKLREALGDTSDRPLYIETVPKRGYRFIAPLAAVANGANDAPAGPDRPAASTTEDAQSAAATGEKRSEPHFRPGVRVAAGALAAVAVLAGVVWYLHRPLPLPRIIDYVQLTNDGWQKFLGGTGGNNLYLNLTESASGIAQIPASGGQFTNIPVDLPTAKEFPGDIPFLADVSADGSHLLVLGHGRGMLTRDLWAVEASGRPARYLTAAQGGAFSRDGKFVAFANEQGDIGVISSNGGEPRIVARSGVQPGRSWQTTFLAWSSDRSRICFTRDNTIWEISSEGAGLHRVLPSAWPGASFACCGRWTPDGDYFVFLSGRNVLKAASSPPAAQLWAVDERSGRWHTHTREPFQLAQGPILWSFPTPSRDGNTIYARGVTAQGQLVRLNRKTNQLERFLGGISAEYVAFSRDGEYIAYVSFPDGILWRVNRDGSGLTQLTRPPFHPKCIEWSPDGKNIAFHDYSAEYRDAIYIVSSQGGDPARLLPADDKPQADAHWSPDGTKIAYGVEPWVSAGSWRQPEIHIVDLATHHDVMLPPGPQRDIWSPKWSPDGRYIVGINTSDTLLYLFDMETQRWSVLAYSDCINFPTWSHDGRSVYFLNLPTNGKDAGIQRVSLKGGKIERLADLKDFRTTGWYSFWFGLDPDDNPLLLRDEGTDEIYALTLERR